MAGKPKQLSVTEIDLRSNFIETAQRPGCFPGIIPHIFRKPFQYIALGRLQQTLFNGDTKAITDSCS